MEVFERQLLNAEYSINGTNDLEQLARFSFQTMDAINIKKLINVWSSPKD